MTYLLIVGSCLGLIGCPGPTPILPPAPLLIDWYILMPVKSLPNRAMPAANLGKRWENTTEATSSFTVEAGSHIRSSGNARYNAGRFELPQLPDGTHDVEVIDSDERRVFAQQVVSGTPTKRVVGGELTNPNDLMWDSLEVIEVFRSITIPAGQELKINPGVIVFLHAGVNIDVSGMLTINGAQKMPVVLLCDDPFGAWGGIYLEGGTANITDCLITQGGGDDSRVFGHSQSQPVIGGVNATLTLRRTAIVANEGKAFGMTNAEVTLRYCLVQRCDTGGEFAACKVTIDDSWFYDMPDNDNIAVDDDNDALYFNGVRGSDTSYVTNSYFIKGKDDAIDHNGAILVVSDCQIDGFDNEGVAGSNANYLRVENCYISNCEQGIESGYGTPFVEVNHCTINGCDNGLRIGDEYVPPPAGRLNVRNTLSFGNRLHNVWSFDNAINGPVIGGIEISYSLVNDTIYNSNRGCITGNPSLTEYGTLLLSPHQPGWKAGMDSLDMGRLYQWPSN